MDRLAIIPLEEYEALKEYERETKAYIHPDEITQYLRVMQSDVERGFRDPEAVAKYFDKVKAAILNRTFGSVSVHQVSPKHLHRYCDEFSGRFNTREVSNTERFDLTLRNSAGRLKYQKLISNR